MNSITKSVILLLALTSFSYADAKTIEEGRAIFVGKKLGNCLACHSVLGDPTIPQTGNLGPKLANLNNYPKDYLFEKIWNPNKNNPTTIMPPMGRNGKLTKVQVESLVEYLQHITKQK